MTKYLVTGAAGFIGSNLVEALVSRGEEVVAVDNFLSGRRENIAPLERGCRFVEGDVRDPDLCADLCAGSDYVLHQAALASVPWSMEDPALAHEHNATATLTLLVAARRAGVRRLVLASTSAIYGSGGEVPSREEQPPGPESPYAQTKLVAEQYLALFTRLYGLPTVALRYFNVYGQRQDPKSAYAAAIPIFARAALRGERPVIFGDGEQTRDFVHVDDAVRANLAACVAGPEADGRVFNVGTGRRVTVNALCRRVLSLLGADVRPERGPERAGDVRHSAADITRAREVLGFEPERDLDSGLERTMGWYRRSLGEE